MINNTHRCASRLEKPEAYFIPRRLTNLNTIHRPHVGRPQGTPKRKVAPTKTATVNGPPTGPGQGMAWTSAGTAAVPAQY